MQKMQVANGPAKLDTLQDLKPISTRDMTPEEFREYQRKLLSQTMQEVAARNYARKMKKTV